MDIIIDSGMTLEQALRNKEIPPEITAQISLLDIDYWGFDQRIHRGQMLVNMSVADDVQEIFSEILDAHFPIEKMIPVVEYGWSDDDSMADNNSSSFNYREIVGGSKMSWHAYGLAIDINPRLNPYIKGDLVLPANARYDVAISGTIAANSVVVESFKKRGWEWGGDWQRLKDWQHFDKANISLNR